MYSNYAEQQVRLGQGVCMAGWAGDWAYTPLHHLTLAAFEPSRLEDGRRLAARLGILCRTLAGRAEFRWYDARVQVTYSDH